MFELTDEFRGNSHLVREEIKTYEMISQFTQGNQNGHWQAVEHTASNKWNIGFNWLTLDDKLNINLRSNIVGSRKVPQSNGYYTDYSPGI